MVLVKGALAAISYIYVSSTQYSGGSWTLLPTSYNTDALCRVACSNNVFGCLEYGFFTFGGASGCYTSTVLSTLNVNTLTTADPGHIIARKVLAGITISNFDASGLKSFAGIPWNNFYTCFSIGNTDGTEDSSSTCGTQLPTSSTTTERGADGSICNFGTSPPSVIPQAFSCDKVSQLASACYAGRGYLPASKSCGVCSGSTTTNQFSSGGIQPCTACPDNSICLFGQVISCKARPYAFYIASATAVASCLSCHPAWPWISGTTPCTCALPNICAAPGAYTSCSPGFGYTHGQNCYDCSAIYPSSFSLGNTGCKPCGIKGGICVSPTSPTLLKCYPGYGFNPTNGVVPSSCGVCSSVSPGTFSLGLLGCASCGGPGGICGSISSPFVSSCQPGYSFAGTANTASASCNACSNGITFSKGGRATACSNCISGTASCDPSTGITGLCLPKYGYSSAAAKTCTLCRSKTYSTGATSVCLSCLPLGAYCAAGTGVPTQCPAGYFYTSPTSNAIASCTACTSGYSIGVSLTGSNIVKCSPCPTGSLKCEPKTGNPLSCDYNAGYGFNKAVGSTPSSCSFCTKGSAKSSTTPCIEPIPICTDYSSICSTTTGWVTSCKPAYGLSGAAGTSTAACAGCAQSSTFSTTYSVGNTGGCLACSGLISGASCDPSNGFMDRCPPGLPLISGTLSTSSAKCGTTSCRAGQWTDSYGGCQDCDDTTSYCDNSGAFTGCQNPNYMTSYCGCQDLSLPIHCS